ncbi:hypothetical protein FSP39_019371 [Pinctada imbricata]|uniref:Trichohyalin-like n=1 Tax=Pinctada imbricata TaxID=66713 RepID=A0AA89C720_PINIB|nr:hypothetical protein FSP39_019371 [Pinctada imbricata]
MKSQGYPLIDIGKQLQEEYKAVIDGDVSCGAALCRLSKRCKEEKEFLLSHVKSESGSTSVLVVENSRLARQQLLLGDEADFPSAAISVGLAERIHEYKSDRLMDWDRIRTERLEQQHLEDRKGRKQRRTPKDETDMDTLEEFGIVNAQGEYVSEIVKKHLYEREALIQMLQGRESAIKKADAKSMRQEERYKQLKILRNQHRNWKSSSSPDPEVVLRILLEAVGLYYENRKIELQESSPKISEEETNASVLADLHQRQEVEFNIKIQELHSKSKEEVLHLIVKENKTRRLEHFDNIAYVILGTLEITEDEKEYMQALEEKYNTLRERVIVMGLRDEKGVDWKRLPDKEKKKEIKERKKQEVKIRGEGNYRELEELIGPRGKAKMLPSLRKLMGEEKGEFTSRFAQQRETGTIYDEAVQGSFDHVNILADLTSRLDSEQEALLGWLKQSDTKSLPIKVQRLKILRLRLETYACKAEEDFEVAARFVGLLERAEASLHGRHMSDNTRQQELATRRSNLRRKRLLDNDMYERKTDKMPNPSSGDLIGWQAAYLRQVILRHDEEREQLLQYLQDETMDDLTEAATMMSSEEKKLRLAELHAKRRKLDLHKSGDQEENICILEEAVAIRFVCRRQEIEQQTRRSPGKDDVIIALLRELQEEQDKEIASILEGIVNLDESELENLRSKEKDSRDSQELTNVFVILTQSEGKAHEKQLIKALTKKYEALQETLIREALGHKHGRKEWDKKSARDKEQMIATVKQQITEMRTAGNNVGLIEVQGGLKWERTVTGLMGMGRHEFLQLASASEGENLLSEEDGVPTDKMYNALGDLWMRFAEEKKHLLQKLKEVDFCSNSTQSNLTGLQEEYMSDIDQQIHTVRLWREELLCYRDNKFTVTSLLVGVAERQRTDGRPRLTGDKTRYENLATSRLDPDVKSVSTFTFKDQVARGPTTTEQMNSAVELLESKHQAEQEFFTRLLSSSPDKALVEELLPLSQQQRKDKLQAISDQRQDVPIERSKEHQVFFEKGLTVKREICRHRMSEESKAEASDSQVHRLLMGELIFAQNMEAEKLLTEFANMNEEDLCTLQAKLISDRKLNVAENVVVVVFSPGLILDGSTEADLLEALDGKYDALRDKLLADALMKQYGEAEWQRMSDLERQKKLAELKLKQKKLRREGKMDELAHILGDAFENQETLKRLMGDTKEEQERKMKERLQKRKQRLAKGMSEEECNKLEEEEIAQEEEEEKKKRRNILLDLEHRYEEEKAELLRQMEEGEDRLSREKSRQLKLMKLRRDERKARDEDKFDSAALVLGLAEEN